MLCYAMPHKDNFLNSFTRIHRREDTRYVVLCVVWIIDDDRSADDADGITVEECHLVKLAILTIFDVDFEFSKIRISKSNPAGLVYLWRQLFGFLIVVK